MKTVIRLLCVITVMGSLILLTGCDPKKTGGGGQQQSYDSSSGQYK